MDANSHDEELLTEALQDAQIQQAEATIYTETLNDPD